MAIISLHLDIYLKVVLQQRKDHLHLLYTTISSMMVTEVDCSQTSISMEIRILLSLYRRVMLELSITTFLYKLWNSNGTSLD
nr:MAG TPA_asm: hypothetical protein [Bacteriophage sp.]DAT27244.1 MAG TPA: hypothetical protein [Caudoviricetes sp.]